MARARGTAWIGGGLAVALLLAARTPARAQDEPTPYWEQVRHPHSARVARLLADATSAKDLAAGYGPAGRARLVARALALLEEAVRLDPRSSQVLSDLADAALEAGEYARAVEVVRARERLFPDERGGTAVLGAALVKLARPEEAIEVITRALDADVPPAERASLLAVLACACMTVGRLEDAIDAYDRALRLATGPGDPWLLLGLAVAYDRDEQLGRAAEVLEHVKLLEPDLAHLTEPPMQAPAPLFTPPSDRHYWLALAYEALGRPGPAAEEWRAYLDTAEPTYRQRAGEHLRAVNAVLRQPAPRRPR